MTSIDPQQEEYIAQLQEEVTMKLQSLIPALREEIGRASGARA